MRFMVPRAALRSALGWLVAAPSGQSFISFRGEADIIAGQSCECYNPIMIIIRFSDPAMERRALGFLAGRYSFRTWDTGNTAVPPQAVAALAAEGISFIVQGPATYEQLAAPVRVSVF